MIFLNLIVLTFGLSSCQKDKFPILNGGVYNEIF